MQAGPRISSCQRAQCADSYSGLSACRSTAALALGQKSAAVYRPLHLSRPSASGVSQSIGGCAASVATRTVVCMSLRMARPESSKVNAFTSSFARKASYGTSFSLVRDSD